MYIQLNWINEKIELESLTKWVVIIRHMNMILAPLMPSIKDDKSERDEKEIKIHALLFIKAAQMIMSRLGKISSKFVLIRHW